MVKIFQPGLAKREEEVLFESGSYFEIVDVHDDFILLNETDKTDSSKTLYEDFW